MASFARWALAVVGPPTYLRIHFRAAARRSLLRLCHEGSETMASNRKRRAWHLWPLRQPRYSNHCWRFSSLPQIGVKIKNLRNHHPDKPRGSKYNINLQQIQSKGTPALPSCLSTDVTLGVAYAWKAQWSQSCPRNEATFVSIFSMLVFVSNPAFSKTNPWDRYISL